MLLEKQSNVTSEAPTNCGGFLGDIASVKLTGVIMLVFDYTSKKELKACVGKPLHYIETSMFGDEYVGDGVLTGCNRPHITGHKREFFARVKMVSGLIYKVE